MEKNNITNKNIIFDNKKIRYTTNTIIENISKKVIFDNLNTFFKNDKMANDATFFIYNNRKSTVKKNIKITTIKNKK
jgi:hypothetical protein